MFLLSFVFVVILSAAKNSLALRAVSGVRSFVVILSVAKDPRISLLLVACSVYFLIFD
jgi:hypothetical protein